jgi:hypothetical protein
MRLLSGALVAEQVKDAGSAVCSAHKRLRTPRCEVPRGSSGNSRESLEGVQLLIALYMYR